jgi:hypothetical protein
MQIDGDKAGEGLASASRGGAKSTSNPKSSTTLHLSKRFQLGFDLGKPVEPKSKAICRYRDDTCPVKEAFLLRSKASKRITKHAHGANRGNGFGRVVTDMLMEIELPIEVEAQIPPIGLRAEGRFFRKGPPSQSERGVGVTFLTRKVK